MVQVPPEGAIVGVVAQALEAAGIVKSPPIVAGFGFVMDALVKVTAVVPLLVKVTVCATVGVPTAEDVNDNEVGATVNGARVFPMRLTICGALPAPERERFAVSVAVPDGV